MTNRIGKAAACARDFAPAGLLVLLFTLLLAPFILSDGARATSHSARTAAQGGVAPSPHPAGGDPWLAASGHAERRSVKAKNGLAAGGGAGKALAACPRPQHHPFETAAAPDPAHEAAPAPALPRAFRSRAPPAAA